MAKREIEAGRAFVLVQVRDKLQSGLKNAQKRLQTFAVSLTKISAGLSAGGAAITAPILAAARQFASVGDQIDKMSGRTGVAASTLSALSHAADLGGTSIESLESGIRRLQRSAFDAASGSKTVADAFEQIGVSVTDANGELKDTDGLLMETMLALASVENETRRAALANVLFGRSGTALLPMLAGGEEGLRAAMEEAKQLGIVMDQDTAASAAALTDAMARVQAVLKGVVLQIGGAVAPILTDIGNRIAKVAAIIPEMIKQNKGLVIAALGVGAALTAFGTAMLALLPAIFGFIGVLKTLSLAISLVSGAFALLASVAGTLLSPLGAVAAAASVGVAAWIRYSDRGKQAASTIRKSLGGMVKFAKEIIGGVAEALQRGDLELAAKIASAGISVAFLSGLTKIRDGIRAVRNWIAERFASLGEILTALMHGEFRAAADIAMAGIRESIARGIAKVQTLWVQFTNGLMFAWDFSLAALRKAWTGVIAWISKGIVRVIGLVHDAAAAVAKVDPSGMAKKVAEATDIDVAGALREIDEDVDRKNAAIAERLNAAVTKRMRDEQMILEQISTEMQEKIDAARERASEARSKVQDLLAKEEAGTVFDEKLTAQKKALEDAMRELRTVVKADEEEKKKKEEQVASARSATGEAAKSVFAGTQTGTFSATATFGLAAGGVNNKMLDATEQVAENTEELVRQARNGRLVFA